MSLTVTNYTNTGTKKDKSTLPEIIFNAPVSDELLSQALRVYASNQRQGTKYVQTRADVDRTTAKVWKQKGTGRARHGSRKAPIFVGGGQAHGPSGIENYQKTLTKRMRRQAIMGALTLQQQNQKIVTVEMLDKLDLKTKTFKTLIQAISPDAKKILIVLEQPHEAIVKAISNLPGVTATQAKRINLFEILNNQQIIIHKPALETLETHFTQSKINATKEK